jgi:capsular polysaccharide transport system permease protein
LEDTSTAARDPSGPGAGTAAGAEVGAEVGDDAAPAPPRRKRSAPRDSVPKEHAADPAPRGGIEAVLGVRPPAPPARMRWRHFGLALSFLVLVAAPFAAVVWYLYAVALDQYASSVGFSVRKEDTSPAIELLGGITELSGSTSNDTDVLYEFIKSQNMVEKIAAAVDFSAIYRRPADPVFSLAADPTIEDRLSYWQRVVDVFYDRSSGLIEIRVKAFAPQDAQRIARLIFEFSNQMINALSAIARDDATRYAQEELDHSVARLKEARAAITAFRTRTSIVDPSADIQGRMGLLNLLQEQLASALIDLDLLTTSARAGDPRLTTAERRVEVIQQRIAAERKRFSSGQRNPDEQSEDDSYSQLVSEYEGLSVDLEFAEKSYVSALSAYDSAVAQAQRKSRYLASYIEPTLAEKAEYPRRAVLSAVIGAVLFVAWSVLAMMFYALRDRR